MTDITGVETVQERNQMFEALADECRRVALSVLSRNGEQMNRTDLAAAVAETIEDDGGATVTVETVLRDLHHVHLPKLAAAGLVTYDVDEETVTYEGRSDFDAEQLGANSSDPPREFLSMADRAHE